jgi:hypothetical protein
MANRKVKVHFEDETWEVPGQWAVCPECEGEKVTENPAFSCGWTGSEWAEEDEDFKENYRRGEYDVQCHTCKGNGLVLEPSWFELDPDEAHHVALSEQEAETMARLDAEDRAYSRMERAMGC